MHVIKKISHSLALLFISMVAVSQVTVKNLRCENLTNPLGIDLTQPRLSWQLVSGKRNTTQTDYEIMSYGSSATDLIMMSGKVHSDQSVYVPYPLGELRSGEKYYWQ